MIIENKIFDLYNVFSENKKFLNEVFVEVSSVKNSYPNIVFHKRTMQDKLSKSLLDDIQKAAEINNLKVTVDYAKTGHGKYTKSGVESRHWKNSAVDIDFIYSGDQKYIVSPKNREIVEKFTNSLEKMGYKKNAEGSSNPKSVLTFGFDAHDNHVHVSNLTDTPFEGEVEADTEEVDAEEVKNIAKDLGKEKDSESSWKELSALINKIGPENVRRGFVSSTFGSIAEELDRFKRLVK